MRLVAVLATKGPSERLGDAWVTDFENIYAPVSWSQRRRHVRIGDSFWLQKCNRKTQFWGQNDTQTPDTSTSRTECGPQLYLNFSKSAYACNVSLCFAFYLNVTLRVLFSVALNHWGRGSTLETSDFPYLFNTHVDKLCKNQSFNFCSSANGKRYCSLLNEENANSAPSRLTLLNKL